MENQVLIKEAYEAPMLQVIELKSVEVLAETCDYSAEESEIPFNCQ